MTNEETATCISDLRRACAALYLEVPASIAADVKAKAEAVIAECERRIVPKTRKDNRSSSEVEQC